jgi:hypothetical protein
MKDCSRIVRPCFRACCVAGIELQLRQQERRKVRPAAFSIR